MKRNLTATTLLILCTAAMQAQTAAPATSPIGTPDMAENAALVKLGGQIMLAGKGYEYDRVLADDIGPRLTGSANYVKAAEWATGEFTRLGLSNVHREPWEISATWEPETYATASIVVPHVQRLHLESDGWSPSTPPGGVRGNVYYLTALNQETVKAQAAQIKDAIVLVDRNSLIAAGPLRFGALLDTIALIASEGARGLLMGLGATNNASSELGITCCNGAISKIPSADVGQEDTLLLRRLMDRGPVEVEFSFTNRTREHVKVDNVVAEIPGTDASGEYVLIGGHLDSWHLGTGAEDNGTGAATVMAIAQAMMASGIKPKRTMRFVLFGGEEEGLLGSIQYVREHVAEMDKCAGVFVTDSGSEAPKGWYVFGREDEQKALVPIKPLLDGLGAGGTTDDAAHIFSTDNGAFLIHGVPAFVLWTPTDKYFLLHHKPSDTFDKVDQRDLNLGVAVVGVTALAFADAPKAMRHLTTAEMEEKLKKIEAFDEYKDMQDHNMF